MFLKGEVLEKKIIIRVEYEVTSIAIIENMKLVELYIENDDDQRIVGNIYRGKVSNVLAGMQSAFIDVGLEKDVFLHVGDIQGLSEPGEDDKNAYVPQIQDVLEIGQEIIIQIMKDPIGTKGARGTTYITLPGRYSVLLPNDIHVGVSRKIEDADEREKLKAIGDELCPGGMGLIIRTVAIGKNINELKADINFLHSLWKKIQHRINKAGGFSLIHNDVDLTLKVARDLFTDDVNEILIDSKEQYDVMEDFFDFVMKDEKHKLKFYDESVNIFEKFGINRAIEKLLQPKVWLKCGGYLIIQKTEALTAIDVNTGKFTGKANLEETVFLTNMESAAEIGRQIRLRDIGGIIIVDFIDMEKQEHKDKVLEALKESLVSDNTRSNLSGITEFGLVEITRRRLRKNLMEVLQQPCDYCNGSGRVLASNFISKKVREEINKIALVTEAEDIHINVHPDVALCLMGEENIKLKVMEEKIGKNIYVRSNDSYHVEEIKISAVI